MEEKIKLIPNEVSLAESDLITIKLGNQEIGQIEIFATIDYLHIEYLHLAEQYRRKGYGYKVMLKLIEECKKEGMFYIDGECRDDLKSFFRELGVDFKSRTEEDETYINNRFYIDL